MFFVLSMLFKAKAAKYAALQGALGGFRGIVHIYNCMIEGNFHDLFDNIFSEYAVYFGGHFSLLCMKECFHMVTSAFNLTAGGAGCQGKYCVRRRRK